MPESKGIRGCCPGCGGSNLKNMGWIEAVSWKAEIWVIDGKITCKASEIITDNSMFIKNSRQEYFDPSIFKSDDHGWECEDCYRHFSVKEAKAAIKGPPLAELLPDMLE